MARNIFVRVLCIFLFLFISIQLFAQIPGEGWVRIGICYSGNITAFAVSPNYENDKTLFVGTSEGGLWISMDRGESWKVCQGFPCDEVVTSIALPKNYEYDAGKPMFAVTQRGHFFSSNDEFRTVGYYYDFDSSQIGIICTDIVAGGLTGFDGILYVGTIGAGVFRNTAGGEGGWENITYGQEGLIDCSSLELTSESTQNLWASALVSSKPYSSIYKLSGTAWVPYASSLNSVDVLDLHIPWGFPQYIYAATRTKGMWYSSNTGSTWNVGCDGTTTGPTEFELKAIATCPNFGTDQELWEGRSDGLRISTNRGLNCSDYLVRSAVKKIEFSLGYHMGGTYCDVFVGTNTGLYRVNCSEGRAATTPIDVDGTAVAMANQTKGVFVGSKVVGLLKSVDNDTLVQYNNFPNGKIPQIVDIALPNDYYEGGVCGDEGKLFVAANFPDSPSDNGVYKSTDFGNSWQKIVGGTGTEWPSSDVTMVDLAISPNFLHDKTLYAATTSRLFRWNDSAEIWIEVGKDPRFDEIAFVALPTHYFFGASCSYSGVNGAPCNMVIVGGKPSGYATPYLNVSYNNGGTFYHKTLFPYATGITFPNNYCYGSTPSAMSYISSLTLGVMSTTAVDFSNRTYRNGGLPTNRYVVDIASDPDWLDTSPTPTEAKLLCAVPQGDGSLNPGIYRSTDYGNWSLVRSGHALSVEYENFGSGGSHENAIAGFRRDGALGLNPPYGAYYSSNSGATFNRYDGYWSLPQDVFSSVAHERNPNYIFASSPSMGVFVSTNKGESFHPYNVGKGGTAGPCVLTNGYGITMLADRRGSDLDVLYVGTTDGIKSRYIHYDSSTGQIRLDYESSGTSNRSGWRHSTLSGGGNTTGYWERLEVVPNSSQNYPVWAVSPERGASSGQGFAALPAGSYEGWIFQNSGLPSNPNSKGVRIGFSSGSGIQPLISGAPIKEIVKLGEWDYYSIEVPNNAKDLNVFLDDPDDFGSQDADLYVRYGALPTDSLYDYRPYTNGDENVCVVPILMENFDESWGPYGDNPPTSWTIVDFGDESPKTWNTNDWHRFENGSYGYSARVYYNPLENQLEDLKSPYFNISSTLSSAVLEFDHYFRNYNPTGEYGKVWFISDQTSWVELAEYTTDTQGMVHQSINLTPYIGNTNCLLAFQYQGYNGWYWIVDNIRVTGSAPQKLKTGTWYIGVRGFANQENGYTLTATINSGCTATFGDVPSGTGKDPKYANFIPPDPKAPIGGTTWGTVTGTGVWKGSGTPSFAESGPQPEALIWVQRNGQTPYYLPNLNTKTIIQLPDTTLIVGCNASSTSDKGIFYSPAGDEGQTQWIEASTVAGTSSKNYVDIIQASNGDVLIAANGTGATPGGVWLSGDKGKNWMRISQGFDTTSQALEDIVADSGTPVSYYASTDATGLWTRTITASPYPTITNINPNNGSDQGGTPVTIAGTGFSNSCPTGISSDCPNSSPVVIFGDVEVAGTWVSSTQITATTPAHSTGSVSVKVRNPDTRQTPTGVTYTFNFTCLPPSGFSNNTATDLNGCADEGVKIDWSAPSNWGDGGSGTRTYDILRNGSVIQTGLPFSTVTYTDTTGVNGTTYSYQVRANNGCGQSTTTTGVSAADTVNPGAPTITAVNDVDSCAQNGVQIVYTAGSGATSHNLYRDGSLAVTGYSSGSTYNPGDTSSHNYVIRAIKGTCYTNSNTMAGTDANNTPGAPTITAVNDVDSCAQNGVQIVYTAGSGATSHNLYRDGSLAVTGYSSGSTYNPGDTSSHNYVIRAIKGTCYTNSNTMAGTDANNTPGAPTITAVNDVDSCAQNGVQIVYTAGSGATSHNLYRDGSLAVTGYSSGSTYNPGDTSSHNYVIRAIKGTCYTNSNTMAGTDANNTPSAPSITGIVDNDPLNLTGITITYTAGSPATKHDLYKDTALVQENFVSGTVYYPLDSDSHSYFIRSVNGSCFADSSPVSGQDQTASTPPPEIATGSSYPDDAQWWTGSVQHWPSSAQANGYKLYRLEKADLPNLQNSTNEGCYRDTGATNSYDCSLDDPSSLTYKVYFYLVTGYNGAGEGSAGDGRQLSSTTICSP